VDDGGLVPRRAERFVEQLDGFVPVGCGAFTSEVADGELTPQQQSTGPASAPSRPRRRARYRAVKRIAQAGRLRAGEERAAQFVHSTGKGVTLTPIAALPEHRDLSLSTMARESVMATITNDAATADASAWQVNAAVSVQSPLDEATGRTPAERLLLGEWLRRISRS
jgi:hypothetical protein